MSERVTWERCPSCGRPAAVGWQQVGREDGSVTGAQPVEFDCPSGCRLLVGEVTEEFGGRRPFPEDCP